MTGTGRDERLREEPAAATRPERSEARIEARTPERSEEVLPEIRKGG
jgi:hypothetical protein